ncbi:MAG: hypothetical protein ACK5KL_15655 [Dysgonomonas sp.]
MLFYCAIFFYKYRHLDEKDRAEFKHKDKVHELLLDKDIIPVYISMDEDNKDATWKEKTKAFNLNGYHLRANKELINLPRPSNFDKLKQELDKHFD